jgi:hypothetical protein
MFKNYLAAPAGVAFFYALSPKENGAWSNTKSPERAALRKMQGALGMV